MKGKLYTIKPTVEHPQEHEYYGSTSRKYLSQRWGQHKTTPSNTLTELVELYGWNNLVCELLEEIEYEDRQELFRRERFYIENNPCCNKQIPSRTKTEFRKIYMEREGVRERKQELQNIRRTNRTDEEKEVARLKHNEQQRIRRATAEGKSKTKIQNDKRTI